MDNITVLSFIEENYIWILVAIVVILMTIIGYIADKNDFMSKNKKDKKKNNNQEQNLYTQKEVEENPVQKEFMDGDFKENYENDSLDDKIDIAQEKELEEMENSNQEQLFGTDVNEEEKDLFDNNIDITRESFNSDIEEKDLSDIMETNNISNINDGTKEIDALDNNIENNDENIEDLYVGLDGTPNAFNEQQATIDIELPEINGLEQNNYEDNSDESDDDMWKF